MIPSTATSDTVHTAIVPDTYNRRVNCTTTIAAILFKVPLYVVTIVFLALFFLMAPILCDFLLVVDGRSIIVLIEVVQI